MNTTKLTWGISLSWVAFLATCFSLSVPTLAHAQTTESSVGLAISPPTFEMNGNPGDTLQNTLRLENLNDTPVTIGFDKKNFTAIGEDGAVGLTEETTSFSLASWLTLDTATYTLPPRGSKSIPFTLRIPTTAEPGGHFGSLVVKTIPDPNLQSSGAVLSQELGALILLRVAGTVQEAATLRSFTTDRNLYEYGPVNLNLRLSNEGSVHLRPQGSVVITNLFGAKVATLKLEGKNVLPGATRQMNIEWPVKLAFGRYTATLVATYGTQQLPLTATTSFSVIPYRLLGGVLLLVLILLALLLRIRKRLQLAFKVLFSGKV